MTQADYKYRIDVTRLPSRLYHHLMFFFQKTIWRGSGGQSHAEDIGYVFTRLPVPPLFPPLYFWEKLVRRHHWGTTNSRFGGFDGRDTDPESLVVKDKRFLWSNPIKVNKSSIKSELVRIWPMRSESKSNLSKIAAGFSGNWIQRNRKHKPKMKTKYRYCSCLHEWEITLNTEWRAKDRVYQLLSKAELYPENIRQSIFLTHYNAFCSLLR